MLHVHEIYGQWLTVGDEGTFKRTSKDFFCLHKKYGNFISIQVLFLIIFVNAQLDLLVIFANICDLKNVLRSAEFNIMAPTFESPVKTKKIDYFGGERPFAVARA